MQKTSNKIEKYVIICDESSRKEKNYSYFYGGAMIKESKLQKLSEIITNYKQSFGFNEIKRTKITEANYKGYIEILDLFFMFVRSGDIKVRVMFSPNNQLMTHIPHSRNETFTKFYEVFIKDAFSIFYAPNDIELRLIFDDLPETKEQCEKFKCNLIEKITSNSRELANKVFIKQEDVEEVDSTKHSILQCVDVIVGLVDFYLNTPKKELTISKRASARYEVWKVLYKYLMDINPNFKLYETTQPIYSTKAWKHKYKHFVYHKKQKKSPATSTSTNHANA